MNNRNASTLVLVALVAIAGCGPATQRAEGPGAAEGARLSTPKRIAAAIMGDPRTVRNSINAAGGSGSTPGLDAVEELVNVGLASLNNESRWVPRLAESVPSLENGLWKLLPDGRMELTWKIRENARWHDGTPVTADDFVFTATVGQDSELPIFRDQMYRLIDGIDAVDARTVLIRWSKPFISAEEMFNSTQTYPFPKHLLEPAYERDKANFAQLPFGTMSLSAPARTGSKNGYAGATSSLPRTTATCSVARRSTSSRSGSCLIRIS